MVIKFSKIKDRELLSQKVHRIIKQDIISGKLQSNTRLFEEKIAEQMAISKTPVREAFRLLVAEGFVKLIPNSGIIVSQISSRELLEVLHIRAQLETYAIDLATQQITETDIKQLKLIIEQTKKAIDSKDDLTYSNLNFKFHNKIISSSGNNKLCEMCDNLHHQSQRWIRSIISPKRMMRSLNEHICIIKALEKKDSERAKKEMYNHLNNVISKLKSTMLKSE